MSTTDSHMEYMQVDVGAGDSAIIGFFDRNGRKKTCVLGVLIDGGIPGNLECIMKKCDDLKIAKIDLIIISHYDYDHLGGILAITNILADREKRKARDPNFETKVKERFQDAIFIDPGELNPKPKEGPALRYFEDMETVGNDKRPSINGRIDKKKGLIGKDVLTFLASAKLAAIYDKIPKTIKFECIAQNGYIKNRRGPIEDVYQKETLNANQRSLGFLITYDKTKIYTAGDLPKKSESELAENYFKSQNMSEDITVDLAKISHHGSDSSTPSNFISTLHPRLVFCSHGNKYGHPHIDIVKRIMEECRDSFDKKPRWVVFTNTLNNAITSEKDIYNFIGPTTNRKKDELPHNTATATVNQTQRQVRNTQVIKNLGKRKRGKEVDKTIERNVRVDIAGGFPRYRSVKNIGHIFCETDSEGLNYTQAVVNILNKRAKPSLYGKHWASRFLFAVTDAEEQGYYTCNICSNLKNTTHNTTSYPVTADVNSELTDYQNFPALQAFLGLSSEFRMGPNKEDEVTVTSSINCYFGHPSLYAKDVSFQFTKENISSGSLNLVILNDTLNMKLQVPVLTNSVTNIPNLIFKNEDSFSKEQIEAALKEHFLYSSLINLDNEFYKFVTDSMWKATNPQLELDFVPYDNASSAEMSVIFPNISIEAKNSFDLIGGITMDINNITFSLHSIYQRHFAEKTYTDHECKIDEDFSPLYYALLTGKIVLTRETESTTTSLSSSFSVKINPENRVLLEIVSSSDQGQLSSDNVLEFFDLNSNFGDLKNKLGLSGITLERFLANIDFGNSEGASLDEVTIELGLVIPKNSEGQYPFLDNTKFDLKFSWSRLNDDISAEFALADGEVVSFSNIMEKYQMLKDIGLKEFDITELSIATGKSLNWFEFSFTADTDLELKLLGLTFIISQVSLSIYNDGNEQARKIEVTLAASVGDYLLNIEYEYDETWQISISLKNLDIPNETLVNLFDSSQFPFSSPESEFKIANFKSDVGELMDSTQNSFSVCEFSFLSVRFQQSADSVSLTSLEFAALATFSFNIPYINAWITGLGKVRVTKDSSTESLNFTIEANPLEIRKDQSCLNGNVTIEFTSGATKNTKKISLGFNNDVDFLSQTNIDSSSYGLNWAEINSKWKLNLKKIELVSDKSSSNSSWSASCVIQLLGPNSFTDIFLEFESIEISEDYNAKQISASCSSNFGIAPLILSSDSIPSEISSTLDQTYDIKLKFLQDAFLAFELKTSASLKLISIGSLDIHLEDFSFRALKITNQDNLNKYIDKCKTKIESYILNKRDATGKIYLELEGTIKLSDKYSITTTLKICDSGTWMIDGKCDTPFDMFGWMQSLNLPCDDEHLSNLTTMDEVRVSIQKDEKNPTLLLAGKNSAGEFSVLLYKGTDPSDSGIGSKFECKVASLPDDPQKVADALGITEGTWRWTTKTSTELELKGGEKILRFRLDLNSKDWMKFILLGIQTMKPDFDGLLDLEWEVGTTDLQTNLLSNMTFSFLDFFEFQIKTMKFSSERIWMENCTFRVPKLNDLNASVSIDSKFSEKNLKFFYDEKIDSRQILGGFYLNKLTIDGNLKPLSLTFSVSGTVDGVKDGEDNTLSVMLRTTPPAFALIFPDNYEISCAKITSLLLGSEMGAKIPQKFDELIQLYPPKKAGSASGKNIEFIYGGPLDVSIAVGVKILNKELAEIALKFSKTCINARIWITKISFCDWLVLSSKQNTDQGPELRLSIDAFNPSKAEFFLDGRFNILGLWGEEAYIEFNASTGLKADVLMKFRLPVYTAESRISLIFGKDPVTSISKIFLDTYISLAFDLTIPSFKIPGFDVSAPEIPLFGYGIFASLKLNIEGTQTGSLNIAFKFSTTILGFSITLDFDFNIYVYNLDEIPDQIKREIIARFADLVGEKSISFLGDLAKKVKDDLETGLKVGVNAVGSFVGTITGGLFGWHWYTAYANAYDHQAKLDLSDDQYLQGINELLNKNRMQAFVAFLKTTIGQPDSIIDESEINHDVTIIYYKVFKWIYKDYPDKPERLYSFLTMLREEFLLDKLKNQKRYEELSSEEQKNQDNSLALTNIILGILYLERKLDFLTPKDYLEEAAICFNKSKEYSTEFPETYFGLFMIDVNKGKAQPNDQTNANLREALKRIDDFIAKIETDPDMDNFLYKEIRSKFLVGMLTFCGKQLRNKQYLRVASNVFSSQSAFIKLVEFNIGTPDLIDSKVAQPIIQRLKIMTSSNFEYQSIVNEYTPICERANYVIYKLLIYYFGGNNSLAFLEEAATAARTNRIPKYNPILHNMVITNRIPVTSEEREIYDAIAAISLTQAQAQTHVQDPPSGHQIVNGNCFACAKRAREAFELAVEIDGNYWVAPNVINNPSFKPLTSILSLQTICDMLDKIEAGEKASFEDLEKLASTSDHLSNLAASFSEWNPKFLIYFRNDPAYKKTLITDVLDSLQICSQRILAILTLHGVPTYSWKFLVQNVESLSKKDYLFICSKTKSHPNSIYELAKQNAAGFSEESQVQELLEATKKLSTATDGVIFNKEQVKAQWDTNTKLDLDLVDSSLATVCHNAIKALQDHPQELENSFRAIQTNFEKLPFMNGVIAFLSEIVKPDTLYAIPLLRKDLLAIKNSIQTQRRMREHAKTVLTGVHETASKKIKENQQKQFNINLDQLKTVIKDHHRFPYTEKMEIWPTEFFKTLKREAKHDVENMFDYFIYQSRKCHNPEQLLKLILDNFDSASNILSSEHLKNNYAQFALESSAHAFADSHVSQKYYADLGTRIMKKRKAHKRL